MSAYNKLYALKGGKGLTFEESLNFEWRVWLLQPFIIRKTCAKRNLLQTYFILGIWSQMCLLAPLGWPVMPQLKGQRWQGCTPHGQTPLLHLSGLLKDYHWGMTQPEGQNPGCLSGLKASHAWGCLGNHPVALATSQTGDPKKLTKVSVLNILLQNAEDGRQNFKISIHSLCSPSIQKDIYKIMSIKTPWVKIYT